MCIHTNYFYQWYQDLWTQRNPRRADPTLSQLFWNHKLWQTPIMAHWKLNIKTVIQISLLSYEPPDSEDEMADAGVVHRRIASEWRPQIQRRLRRKEPNNTLTSSCTRLHDHVSYYLIMFWKCRTTRHQQIPDSQWNLDLEWNRMK